MDILLDDEMVNEPLFSEICINCKHLTDIVNKQCTAFPEGIPREIWEGENDHSEPLPDQDNDIVHEPIRE